MIKSKMNHEYKKKELNNAKGITLIALIITIVILIIIAGVTIKLTIGENGIYNKAKYAKSETEKQEAIELLNLKIMNIKISNLEETERKSNLQYVADKLCEDDDIEFISIEENVENNKNKIDIGDSEVIYTKLKRYKYKFEINKSLQTTYIGSASEEKKEEPTQTTYDMQLNYQTKDSIDYTLSASSELVTADHIFDNSLDENTGCWHSNRYEENWLQFSFKNKVCIQGFDIQNRNYDDIAIKNFVLEASNNGVSWTTLSSYTHGSAGKNYLQSYTVSNDNYYYHYRIRTTSTYGGYAVIGEMKIDMKVSNEITLNAQTKDYINYTLTASSELVTADHIFDNSLDENTGCWHSEKSEENWIQIYFNDKAKIQEFCIQNRNYDTVALKDFVLEVSNDGISWIALSSYTHESQGREYFQDYEVQNAEYYHYYRWRTTSTYGGYAVIGEMKINMSILSNN